MDKKAMRPRDGFKFQIPFMALVPRDVNNLLVAGRCISCTHEALGSLRVMPQCGIMGQAAGTASTLSIRDNVDSGQVNMQRLTSVLREQQCILNDDDIRRETGSDPDGYGH